MLFRVEFDFNLSIEQVEHWSLNLYTIYTLADLFIQAENLDLKNSHLDSVFKS